MHTRTVEHRWGDRVSVDIPVQLIMPAHPALRGRMTSFSDSGASVEINFHVPTMTNMTLMMEVGGRSSIRPRTIACYVSRQIPGGMAVGWWELAPVTMASVIWIQETLRPAAEPSYAHTPS